MAISFERLISRNLARFISDELDLSGVKITINRFIEIAILGGFALLIIFSFFSLLVFNFNFGIAAFIGIVAAGLFEFSLYAILEYMIDKRKSFVDEILPDYLQIASANMRSGVSLDKALISAARPDFKYFKDDVLLMAKQLYFGETMTNALINLSNRYRSLQLKRTARMMTEAMRYGGGMADILSQISKDLRNQQIIQKEIGSQLLMYTIFIIFAAVIGAPTLYALTNKMIGITDTIWSGILQQNPNGLSSVSQVSTVSFLKPQPPTITPSEYNIFSLVAIILISGISAFIVASISSGAAIRGLKYLPVFIIIGLAIFFLVSIALGGLFSNIGSAA
ncbi:MAG: type II secretion system F family protein [Candidatus Micrarchaeia archaeon]